MSPSTVPMSRRTWSIAPGCCTAWGVRFRAVPGNHDVGDAGSDRQPVNDERLLRWRTHFGPDGWVEDVENYRLIGLNALLLGSGHPEEATQARWFETVMNTPGDGKS